MTASWRDVLEGKARWVVIEADCADVLREMPEASIDAVVTDPPYELGFMGKHWDASGIAFDAQLWGLVLAALKPGGHLLAFGGTRTAHRMACAIEDAGFEIRDDLHWFYGTGFPKSVNLGKGRGSALKPGHEPVYLARKPLDGTLAANVAKWGAGALNIDACRLAAGDAPTVGRKNSGGKGNGGVFGDSKTCDSEAHTAGRWPANVLLDEAAAAELDAQSGERHSSGIYDAKGIGARLGRKHATSFRDRDRPNAMYSDSGGASRFFYVAKPGRKERDAGCEQLPARTGGEATDREDGSAGVDNPRAGAGRAGGARNFHPTVKPVELMRYLVRLVTPRGGVVLDMFAGSGTTGMAASLEGARFVGLERERDYVRIAKARILSAGGGPRVRRPKQLTLFGGGQ